MSAKKLCIHQIDDPVFRTLTDYKIVATSKNRDELRNIIGAEHVAALIIDLDAQDAFDIVVEALEIRPGLAVIGVTGSNDVNRIIRAQRAGCRQLTCKPLDENDLRSALKRALAESDERPAVGKTIAVIGTQGGAGATTVSCYLAMSIADFSPTLAFLDLDLEFGTVAKAWDLSPRYTIADLREHGEIDRHTLEETLLDLPSGISVLPRPEEIEQSHTIDETLVRNILNTAGSTFPYVVIDLPRKLDAITGAAIEACHKLLIVTQLNVTGILNAGRLHDGLTRFGVPAEKMEFAINRFSKGISPLDVKSLEQKVHKKSIGVIPNHYKSLSVASDLGQPVSESNPVRKAINEIANTLCGREAAPVATGWMARLGFGGSKD
ncbi:MAG: AAA family ATPase [Phycisphaerae bacterium]|nr:AAA family ATPase [Phycisphaerae bacterium]